VANLVGKPFLDLSYFRDGSGEKIFIGAETVKVPRPRHVLPPWLTEE
jgi:hypothetical protein